MLSDGTWTYTWKHGRQLASMSDGSATWTFTYNSDGLRTRRTNGTATYHYVYNGGSLSQMTVGSDTLNFAYDASGAPMSVSYNGTNYYYATNLQGDVTAILNASGTAVVQYTYDAWGNPLTTSGSMANTLGTLNPLRYRGYVYDVESGLYYLQSRYYSPAIGRFLNADAFASTGQGILGCNMFVYCNNNPIKMKDSLGALPEIAVLGSSVESDESSDEIYIVTIFYCIVDPDAPCCPGYEEEFSTTIEICITNSGVLTIDNSCENTRFLSSAAICDAIATEAMNIANKKVEGALNGRTIKGISMEIRLHYLAYTFHFLRSHTEKTDIGSKLGNIGYDSNAWFFELFA